MDPLSDVLSLLRPRSYTFGGMDIGKPWSVSFGRHQGIKCYALYSGECWLTVDGISEPTHLVAGDCFLLTHGRPFVLTSDLTLPPVDVVQYFSRPANGTVRTFHGGGDCFSVGGHFLLDGPAAGFLLEVLPPVVHLRSEQDRASLRWSLDRMRQELRNPQPGGLLLTQHLASMMLIQALRLHLNEGTGTGWLAGLADAQIGQALRVLHGRPAHRWTLHELAAEARMSRSSFAQRFRELVGASPIDYLARWRMLLAADRLRTTTDSIAAIAFGLGYESESAFSTAFRRIMGSSPRRYARDGLISDEAQIHEAARKSIEDLPSHEPIPLAG
ncbi:AraC family transcriptional regulator [Silvibacterium dinghuense]|uniref:AraC family transcriptional regulator n=1 Tax=Silvibacterium dinghuense TaxID=1560006 RepID=A0A4V1NVT4_9BACT|nr:AraC family transcriptional regulator [Silvibacterium dinghuense]RXS97032.1 AraC family transcriptional regulator [Silvibacterium dinghuense]GGG95634.1 AraC family transcriptional regulator [Silvibacterium dinghuense]